MAEKKFDFEKSLQELESIVNKMEQGELNLEESLKLFENGINLTRKCQKKLQDTEQKVKILMQKNTKGELVDFSNEE